MTFFRRKKSVNITESDPTYKVIYLGNVLTLVAKGEECSERPLQTLWKNYTTTQRKDIKMKLTICNSGLKAETLEHGLTEYWANRITFCGIHPKFPKLFAWIYRHEGKKMKPELRFHAVLCSKSSKAEQMTSLLQQKIVWALNEFKRDKISKQNARRLHEILAEISPTVCKRRQILSTGQNFRPPLERSKSAPRLVSIEEEEIILEEDEELESSEDLERFSKNSEEFSKNPKELERFSKNSEECERFSKSSGEFSRFAKNSEELGGFSTLKRDFSLDKCEEIVETDDDDGFMQSSPSWSVSSSPAGSWNVKRRSSSSSITEMNDNVDRVKNISSSLNMQDLRKAIEETSSVESGYEEPQVPT